MASRISPLELQRVTTCDTLQVASFMSPEPGWVATTIENRPWQVEKTSLFVISLLDQKVTPWLIWMPISTGCYLQHSKQYILDIGAHVLLPKLRLINPRPPLSLAGSDVTQTALACDGLADETTFATRAS